MTDLVAWSSIKAKYQMVAESIRHNVSLNFCFIDLALLILKTS